jgi:hypothetical protein
MKKADDIASAPQDKLKYWIVEDVAHAQGLNWNRAESIAAALAIQQQPWQADPRRAQDQAHHGGNFSRITHDSFPRNSKSEEPSDDIGHLTLCGPLPAFRASAQAVVSPQPLVL